MGMKAVRAARKYHAIPRAYAKDTVCDPKLVPEQSGTDSVLRDREVVTPFPMKTWPEASEANFPLTKPPTVNTRGLDGEGPRRGRQADKSSRIK